MPEQKVESPALKSVITIVGLVISLFGNFLQYGSLQQKKIELQQAQAKIDAANEVEQRRQNSRTKLLSEYTNRMEEIDRALQEAANDNSRAQVGMALGKPEDQQYASSLLTDSNVRHSKLIQEKKELQEKIDALRLSDSPPD